MSIRQTFPEVILLPPKEIFSWRKLLLRAELAHENKYMIEHAV